MSIPEKYIEPLKKLIKKQGLIQKEKTYIDCKKDAQIDILANKIAIK